MPERCFIFGPCLVLVTAQLHRQTSFHIRRFLTGRTFKRHDVSSELPKVNRAVCRTVNHDSCG
jgi:hypothetical protein